MPKGSRTQLSDIEENEPKNQIEELEETESESEPEDMDTSPPQEINDEEDDDDEDDEDDEGDEDDMPMNPDMFDDTDVDIQEVLTQFFQNSEGENIPDLMNDLRVAVDNNSKCILKVVKELKTMNSLYAKKK